MSDQKNAARVGMEERTPRRIGASRSGLLLAFAFSVLGGVNVYLLPHTGGVIGVIWDPFLYDLFLNRFFLVVVYIPLIQLPLATVYALRSRAAAERIGRGFAPTTVFGLFVVLALASGVLLVAETRYPWDAGGLQFVVDAILFERIFGVSSLPDIVTFVYLGYFPLVVLVKVLTDRYRRDGPGRSATTEPPAADSSTGEPASVNASSDSIPADARHARSTPAAARPEKEIPFWGVVGGVVIVLLLGLVLGGLPSAIGIASLILTLYEMQPHRET